MTIHDPRHHRFALNNGDGEMPALGFGTLVSDSSKTRHATVAAVEAGFPHLACAERYRNEAEVGVALKDLLASGAIRRQDVFVTTKLWNNNHRPERVKPAFEASLRRAPVDYPRWHPPPTPFAFQPGDDQEPRDERRQIVYDSGVTLGETWQALEGLVEEGRCRTIGLS